MQSLRLGISIGLISSVWISCLSLGLAPVYVNLVGIEGYGFIGLYSAALAIGGVLDVSVSTTVARKIASLRAVREGQASIRSLLLSAEIVYWTTLVLSAAALIMAATIFGLDFAGSSGIASIEVKQVISLMLVSLVVQLPTGLYVSSLIGLNRQSYSSAFLACCATLRGLGAVLVCWLESGDVRYFFIWYAAVGLFQTFWLRKQAWLHSPTGNSPARFNIVSLLEIRKATGATLLITAMGLMLSQVDKFILAFVVPMESLGLYSLAWAITSGITVVCMPIMQGFDTRFSYLEAKADQKGLGYQLYLGSQITYSLVIPVTMALLVLSRGFWIVWLQDRDLAQYYDSLMLFLAIGTSTVACTYPILVALYAKKMFRPVLVVQSIAMLVFIPVLLLLVDSLGTVGAALSWAAYGTCLLVSYTLIASLSGWFQLPKSIITPFFVRWVQMLVLGIPSMCMISRFESIPIAAALAVAVGLTGVLVSVVSTKELRHYASEYMVGLGWSMRRINAGR